MRHSAILLDANVAPTLSEFFPHGTVRTANECGLASRADDMEVIFAAAEHHALLVTADQGFLRKCRQFQAQRRRCLFGLLLVPNEIEIQRRIFADLKKKRRKLTHAKYDHPICWSDVRFDNLGVFARAAGDPEVFDLCDCAWEDS